MTILHCEIDVLPGGAILIHMHGANGSDYQNEIVESERIVYDHGPRE